MPYDCALRFTADVCAAFRFSVPNGSHSDAFFRGIKTLRNQWIGARIPCARQKAAVTQACITCRPGT